MTSSDRRWLAASVGAFAVGAVALRSAILDVRTWKARKGKSPTPLFAVPLATGSAGGASKAS